jgi:hypothetical protein
MDGQKGLEMTDKLSSILGRRIGANPANKSGSTGQEPINMIVQLIWDEEYCRQNPELAAKCINFLIETVRLHDQQDKSVANILKTVAEELMEVQRIVRL